MDIEMIESDFRDKVCEKLRISTGPKHIPLGLAPWNSFSACLLAENDRIGGDRLDLLSRGHVIPLGSAPWNEICAMSRLLRGMLSIPSEGNLVQRDGSIPLGFTL